MRAFVNDCDVATMPGIGMRGPYDLMNEAYGLTPAKVALLWETAPPRMPVTPAATNVISSSSSLTRSPPP